MPIVYDKFFQMLKNKNISQYSIKKDKIITDTSLHRLRNNEPVSTATIEKICKEFNCSVDDIMEFRRSEE